ncbi:uncharacterized protein [Eurosta solidaginis]|uniref:uncharacterized protein n=1 Tax=Eurosta solidaginis TaxID=178769 RepID=UPI00353151E3
MASFVKVKSGNVIKFIEIRKVIDDNTEEITTDDIIYSVGLAFDFHENAVLKFRDRDGANIENDHLHQIVQQYGKCSCFLLEVFNGDKESISKSLVKTPVFQIHSAALEAHLRSGDYSHILREYSDSGTHTESSRRLLVREAVSFMRHHFGNYPTKTQKIATAEAIIALFQITKLKEANMVES